MIRRLNTTFCGFSRVLQAGDVLDESAHRVARASSRPQQRHLQMGRLFYLLMDLRRRIEAGKSLDDKSLEVGTEHHQVSPCL